MPITYHLDRTPTPKALTALYRSAGLRRPVDDPDRMAALVQHANLWATAWDDEQLVGVARSLTDFRWCCYLSDLAVYAGYQRQGIGRQLIEATKQRVGDECMVLLLSVDTALRYYPHVGMAAVDNGFILHRKR
ncbi:GNAT family N-acetyltransferase [Hymenobacter jeollabukensis]|uniref:GNAT family N-acetyltransferase n=1 Tax=Hymenobacter jeollabukensis TaxID=2025313 RepID=A0A5R8WQI9_9BACT|nr:GNAT family N-acetyltransferase [Hymenobacter jeollabukensis]TLM92282.1 GNAT family N-acetyltransferase [Hymenobacter jeollabukensis]